jgi:hypothetical protein
MIKVSLALNTNWQWCSVSNERKISPRDPSMCTRPVASLRHSISTLVLLSGLSNARLTVRGLTLRILYEHKRNSGVPGPDREGQKFAFTQANSQGGSET